MKKQKTIGIDVKIPNVKCSDKKCPYHGSTKVRGRIFIGEVVSKDTHKSAKVLWNRLRFIPKYERYEKKFSKISTHNPSCIDAQVGDKVKIMETRPLSKTKHFIIIEKIKNEKNIG